MRKVGKMTSRGRSKASRDAAAAEAIELKFRGQHSPILGIDGLEHLDDRALPSDIGRPAYRAVDTLGALLQKNSITGEQYTAGRCFQDDFSKGHYDQLQAASLERINVPFAERDITEKVVGARDEVRRVMVVLGGPETPIALAVWWVVGFGLTVKDFCARERLARRRPLNQQRAIGLVDGGLTVLGGYYGGSSRPHMARSGAVWHPALDG